MYRLSIKIEKDGIEGRGWVLENLEVIELYENANQEKTRTFMNTAESTLKVQTEKKYITRDIEWINFISNSRHI